MKSTIFFLILTFSTTFCQQREIQKYDSWNISESFKLKKDIRTTIVLYDKDSSEVFYLYDNIVDKNASLRFILNEKYWDEKNKYNDDIILPLPPLVNKLYFIRYSDESETVIKKFIYIR